MKFAYFLHKYDKSLELFVKLHRDEPQTSGWAIARLQKALGSESIAWEFVEITDKRG